MVVFGLVYRCAQRGTLVGLDFRRNVCQTYPYGPFTPSSLPPQLWPLAFYLVLPTCKAVRSLLKHLRALSLLNGEGGSRGLLETRGFASGMPVNGTKSTLLSWLE